jgi:hypothetical protein
VAPVESGVYVMPRSNIEHNPTGYDDWDGWHIASCKNCGASMTTKDPNKCEEFMNHKCSKVDLTRFAMTPRFNVWYCVNCKEEFNKPKVETLNAHKCPEKETKTIVCIVGGCVKPAVARYRIYGAYSHKCAKHLGDFIAACANRNVAHAPITIEFAKRTVKEVVTYEW